LDVKAQLHPGRDFLIALGFTAIAGAAIFAAPGPGFPVLHTILNTGIALSTVAVSLLFWDLGWRTGEIRVRFLAIVFAVAGVLEVLHVMAALEPSSASEELNTIVRGLRSGTWAPPAYLLPLGTAVILWWQPTGRTSKMLFALAAVAVAGALFALFQWLPDYAEPGFFGIIRPTLLVVPLLWIPVVSRLWRQRHGDRLAHALAYYGLAAALAHSFMLYSDVAISKFAMTAHFGVFAGGLMLLLSLMQMGTADTARRMGAEEELLSINEALEVRVAARTVELEAANTDLRREIGVRHAAEGSALLQLERLGLLQRITRAIAERQDLASIFQVVVRSLEEHLPVDFTALCSYEAPAGILTVNRVGTRSAPLALELAMTESSRIEIDRNGLSRCVAGELVYETDIASVNFPFPRRLARGGLHSMVCAPLVVEPRGVFGVLIVARRVVDGFSAGEREFLRQLCDHVSLAANQAQLHDSLRQAYDDLRRTQEAVLEQERLRALGQMASGIAHDINNAISPVAVYVDALLTHETGFSQRAREQLTIIQRAVEDVAHTVARMGEFYRKHSAQLKLEPVSVKNVLHNVLDLTRARWIDMAQERGVVVEAQIEAAEDDPTVMGIESELREALVNLVFNAVDAMPGGGRLALRAGRAGDSVSRVFIEVADTGVGMDDATRRRCLEPFFTTKGERGSGLGLAMVYGIAQRHGADLEIVSAPGEGSTFRILFPALTPVPLPKVSDSVALPPRNTRILLIDDDPVLLTSLREVLEQEGHEIKTANGGKAGIEAFLDALNAGLPFPVVITDLGMPHVDGRAVAAAIKAAAAQTSIIMLTGWGQRLVEEGDTPDGVRVVLGKPPRLADLRRCLASCGATKTGKEPTEKVTS
jgi:signal transduction histidine kinase/CheY-like chemotaxis protein